MSNIQSLSENLNNREILLLNQLQQYSIRVDEGLWLLSDPPKNLLENNLRNVSNRIIQALNALEEKGITEKRSNEIYLTSDVTWKEFLRWRKSRAGTGAQPLQDLKFTGRGNPPVVDLLS